MRATGQVIAERGVAGLTVGQVAQKANIAVGTIYTRFADRDALVAAFAADFFARARGASARALSDERCARLDACGLAERVVRLLVEGYRAHRRLLSALYLHARTRPDAVTADVASADADFAARLTALFLARRAELTHPRPERAIAVALLMLDGAAKEAVLFGRGAEAALDDADLIAELTRAFAASLTLLPPSSPTTIRATGTHTPP
ncbi:MAG TPA: helix-turn-helix domain-containing protein [Gemmatimonadales bacterium]|nr:helix-turn-helix domain-containing protein [Gemmatimonadales bacterium]